MVEETTPGSLSASRGTIQRSRRKRDRPPQRALKEAGAAAKARIVFAQGLDRHYIAWHAAAQTYFPKVFGANITIAPSRGRR